MKRFFTALVVTIGATFFCSVALAKPSPKPFAPAPTLVSAIATSLTNIQLTFDQNITAVGALGLFTSASAEFTVSAATPVAIGTSPVLNLTVSTLSSTAFTCTCLNLAANAVTGTTQGNNVSNNNTVSDGIAPTVTINQAGGQNDPTNTSPISYTIVFSEAINPATFTNGDITLGGTATGKSVNTLTTSDNITWTLTVAVTGSQTGVTVIPSIAASAVQDPAGNNNAASTNTDNTVTFDNVAPTVTINQAGGQNDPTNTSPISYTIVFSEAINPATFTNGDITLGGTATGQSVNSLTTSDNITWTLTVAVTGSQTGVTVIPSITASAVQDPAGNNNAASTNTDNTVTFDNVAPTVTINQAGGQNDPTNTSPISYTIVFSEAINPATFTNGDITLGGTATGQSVNSLTTSDNITWTLTVAVTGSQNGVTVIPSIAASAVQDPTGNNNAASTNTDNTVTFDNVAPTVTINQAGGQNDPTNTSPISYTIVFSEAINPATFTNGDITLGGTATGQSVNSLTTSDNITWTLTVAVTGSQNGVTVIPSIAASAVQDPAGNNNAASTNTDNTVTFDNVAPTVTINQAGGQNDPTNTSPISYTIVFSEAINPATFTNGDITLGGTATGKSVNSLTTSDNITWTLTVAVTGSQNGVTVIPSIAASAVQDPAGNNNAASTNTDNTVTFDNVAPTVAITLVSATPSTANSLDFTVTFSESVTGVDLTDFVLATGTANDALGAAPTVTGSGSTYTVTVASIVADYANGTQAILNLDLVGSTGITDASGNAFGGSVTTDNQYVVDNTKPTVVFDDFAYNANGGAAETVVFTMSEPLNASLTNNITGFTIGGGSGTPAPVGVYNSANNTVTLTSGANGDWPASITVTYTPGNMSDLLGNTMSAISATPVSVPNVNLQAGDIAITGMNSKGGPPNDGFSFVLLKDIPANTKIFFTNQGWNGTALQSGEFTVTWTSPGSVLSAGTEVYFTQGSSSTSPAGTGTVLVAGGTFNLDSTGDQILAYQGSAGSPSVFIAAMNNSSSKPGGAGTFAANNWNNAADVGTNTNRSALPTGLTEGTNAISFAVISGGAKDDVQYKTTGVTKEGSAQQLRTSMCTVANFNTADNSAFSSTGVTYKIRPVITAVTIPNSVNYIISGTPYTATITVHDDRGSAHTLLTSNIDGFALSNLQRTNSTTYTADFTVAQGGTDVAAGTDINISVDLQSAQGNATAAVSPINTVAKFTTAISQNADPIDAHAPTIVSIGNSPGTIKVGALTQTVTVVYSETMKTSVQPTITLSAGTHWGAQTNATGGTNGWFTTTFTNDTYKATFTHDGTPEEIASVQSSVGASGTLAQDALGNPNTGSLSSSAFIVDTKIPTLAAANITFNKTSVNVSNTAGGSNTIRVIVQYSEKMKNTVAPAITFSSGTFGAGVPVTGGNSGWFTTVFTDDTYKADFTNSTTTEEFANVTASVSGGQDVVGNAQSGTTASTATFSIDTKVPTVSSSNRVTSTPTNATSLQFLVTFSESVSTIDITDFVLTNTGTASGTISSVDVTSGSSVTVTVNSVAGDGTMRLDVKTSAAGATLQDGSTNPLNGGFTGGQAYTIDHTAPTVQSLTVIPSFVPNTGSTTNGTFATSVIFRITFSEDVSGIAYSGPSKNFTAQVTGTVTPGTSTGSASTSTNFVDITVPVTRGTGGGKIRLDFQESDNIVDAAGNPVGGVGAGSFLTTFSSVPQYYSIVLPAPNAVGAFFDLFDDDIEVEFEIDQDLTVGAQLPTHYLIIAKELQRGVLPSVINSVLIPDDPRDGTYPSGVFTAGDGIYTVNLPFNSSAFNDFFLLKTGAKYDFIVYPYTRSANYTDDNITYGPPTTVSNFLVGPVATNSFLTSIPSPAPIASTFNSAGNMKSVFTFQVTDGTGTFTFDENAPTKFSAITIGEDAPTDNITDWSTVIAGAELFDIASPTTFISASSITSNQINFTSIPSSLSGDLGFIDGTNVFGGTTGKKTYGLRIYLNSAAGALTDHSVLAFKVTDASVIYNDGLGTTVDHQQSSKLQTGTALSGANTIDVKATQLVVTTQPSSTALVLTNFVTPPVIKAEDANGNFDIDYSKPVTVTAAGITSFVNLPTTAVNGTVSFTTFQYGDSGDGTLTIIETGATPSVTGITTNPVAVSYSNVSTIASVSTVPSVFALSTGFVDEQPYTFSITDDGGAGGDGSPTRISQIKITKKGSTNPIPDWRDILNVVTNGTSTDAGALIFDGATSSYLNVTVTVNQNDITISNMLSTNTTSDLGYIADGATKTFNLYIWFKSTMTGGLQSTVDFMNFDFQVIPSDISLSPQSSLISPSQLNINSGLIDVDVEGTSLKFITDLTSPLLPLKDINLQQTTPQLEIVDANGNRDLDINTSAISVNNAGPILMNPGGTNPISISSVNGLINFPNNFQYQTTGNGTLTISTTAVNAISQSITSIGSSPVTVQAGNASTITDGVAAPALISSLVNSSVAAVPVFNFDVNDDPSGTASNNNDGFPTLLSSVKITANNTFNSIVLGDWSQAIAGAILSDGNPTNDLVVDFSVTPTAITANSITFTSINTASGKLGFVGDNLSKSYTLKIWLKSSLANTLTGTIDGAQFEFEVLQSNITLAANSTLIIGGQSSNSGNKDVVDVVATQLVFTNPSAPASASLNTNLPGGVVQAQDANGNLDKNFTGIVTAFSNAAGDAMANAPTIGTTPFIAGVLNISNNFQFTSGSNNDIVTLSIKADNVSGNSGTSCGTSAICGTSPVITLISAFESFLTKDPTFTVPATIPYISHQEAVGALNNSSYELIRVLLVDGSRTSASTYLGLPLNGPNTNSGDGQVHGDVDGASTNLTSLQIQISRPSDLKAIGLFTGGSLVQSIDVTAIGSINNTSGPYTFTFNTGGNMVIALDDTSAVFSIRASFRNTSPELNDHDDIQLKLIDAQVGGGSQFFNGNPANSAAAGTYIGGMLATSINSQSLGKIDVVATQLVFTNQPPATAGINQPVPYPAGTGAIVKARDASNLLDIDFNNNSSTQLTTATVSGATALVSNPTFNFNLGVLDLSTLVYSGAGNGTLTVVASGMPSGVSAPTPGVSNHVDVYNVFSTANNAVVPQNNLAGGAVNKVVFGVTFSAPYVTSGKPRLKSFTIGFGDPTSNGDPNTQPTPSIAAIFKNFRLFENINGPSFGGAVNISSGGTPPATITVNASSITITFNSARDFNVSTTSQKQLNYFLQVDVDPSANGSTPTVQPYIKDFGYSDPASYSNILITDGTTSTPLGSAYSYQAVQGETLGLKFTFAAIFPPVLVSSYPANGQVNINVNQPTIALTFNVPVWALDNKVYLYSLGRTNPKLALKLCDDNTGAVTTTRGQYPGTSNLAANGTLFFRIPAGALKNDSVYFISVAKGKLGNPGIADPLHNFGVMDGSGNLFPGFSSPSILYFRAVDPIANPTPPKLLAASANGIQTAIVDATPSGATIIATFDKATFGGAGKAYFLVVNKNDSPPTSIAQINGSAVYPTPLSTQTGSTVAIGSFPINQIDPVSQSGVINSSLAPGGKFTVSATPNYDVYMYAESYFETNGVPSTVATSTYYGSDFAVGSAGPTLTFNPSAIGASVAFNNPSINICSDSYQVLNQPITIIEGSGQNDFAGGLQTFNLLLPLGFQFDTSTDPFGTPIYGSVALSGTDFSGAGSLKFLGASVLQVTFTNSGNSSLDNITILGLRIIGTGSAGGFIQRLGGTGISGIPDGTTLASISSSPSSPIAANFTNSYSTTDYAGKPTVTSIPDNFHTAGFATTSVQLIPAPLANDFGLTSFIGQGVTGDSLHLASVSLGIPFNITASHTDNNGCVSQNPVQYLVYDHNTGIGGLTPPPPYCVVNSNFTLANTSAQATPGAIHNIPYNGLTGYYLLSVSADLPATSSNQIIDGTDWQTLLRGTNVATDPRTLDPSSTLYTQSIYTNGLLRQGNAIVLGAGVNPVPGQLYYNYTFDESWILNANASVSSLSSGTLTDPYLTPQFIKTSGQNQTYYQGGSLGIVEFTAIYQSIANSASQVPIKQNIEFFVPAVPLIEVSQPSATAANVNIYCEFGGAITINGYPAASAGASVGTFALSSVTPGAIQNYPGAAFVDNGNGTATLYPYLLQGGNNVGIINGYNDIQISYTYKDNNSPCQSTAYFVIRIAPNPIAKFGFTSVPLGALSPNASNLNAICLNNQIDFDASSSIGGGTAATYTWDFGDPNSGTLNSVSAPNQVIAPHTFASSSTYNVSLNIKSNYNCPSLPYSSPVQGVVPGPLVVQVKVGDIPVPDFSVAKNCVGDLITFNPSNSTVAGNSTISNYNWDYNYQVPVNGLPAPNPATAVLTGVSGASTTYSKSGFYNVLLTTITTLGCQNSKSITISQLDVTSAFGNNFDLNNGGWQALDLSQSTLPNKGPLPSTNPASKTSWIWGATSGKANSRFNSPTNNKLWSTSGNSGSYYPNENSALYSGCLNIDVPRPMIAYSSFVDVNTGDGLVLQYSIDDLNILDKNKVWINLGTTATTTTKARPGIDWFNAVGLPSTPGSNTSNSIGTGWTGTGKQWIHPKHSLDTVAGQSRVILRFAYSSLSSTNNTDGVAIDSIFFGSRTRTILFENFTTTNAGGNTSVNSDISSDADAITKFVQATISQTQLVNLNYHVGFMGMDPFNLDNPADPSARALYYGVKKLPYAYLDGLHYSSSDLNKTNRDLFQYWGQAEYDLNTLQLAKADFTDTKTPGAKLTTVTSNTVNAGGSIDIDVNFTPEFDLPYGVAGGTVLQVAILEKVVTNIPSSWNRNITTGETSFHYVVKKMLPDASGTKFKNPLTAKVPVSAGKFTWVPENVHSSTFTVVVFLQNESTKEVYQAYLQDDVAAPGVVTAIEPFTAENINIYPNPADDEFTVELPYEAKQSVNVRLANQLGQFTEAGVIAEGEKSKRVSTQGLAEGVYILQIGDKNSAVRAKIIVLHK